MHQKLFYYFPKFTYLYHVLTFVTLTSINNFLALQRAVYFEIDINVKN